MRLNASAILRRNLDGDRRDLGHAASREARAHDQDCLCLTNLVKRSNSTSHLVLFTLPSRPCTFLCLRYGSAKVLDEFEMLDEPASATRRVACRGTCCKLSRQSKNKAFWAICVLRSSTDAIAGAVIINESGFFESSSRTVSASATAQS